jgi:hypothetical protein
VLAHAGDNSLGPSLAAHADGVVFHGPAGYKVARSCPATALRLIDEEQYRTERDNDTMLQLFERKLFERTDIAIAEAQLAAGTDCLLAPGRFPRDRTERSLRTILEAGGRFIEATRSIAPQVPAFVPVIVRFNELEDGRWVKPIRDSGLPIATVFAGYRDPLGTPRQLEGAIDIVRNARAALVLRCDMSVAGLMALSAIAGAIGSSSAVRHLWLPSRKRRDSTPSPSIFVPSAANWMKLATVRQATGNADLDEIFRCNCACCGPHGDVRYLASPEVARETRDLHSVAASVALAHAVISSPSPLNAWRAMCETSEEVYDRLSETGVDGARRPGAVHAWLTVLG